MAERAKLKHLQRAILAFASGPPNIDLTIFPQAADFIANFDGNRPCVEIKTMPDTQPGENRRKGWHNYGRGLAEYFCAAIRFANPDLDLSLSNPTGPVARFMEAVIPAISGETATAAAIAAYFGRMEEGKHSPEDC